MTRRPFSPRLTLQDAIEAAGAVKTIRIKATDDDLPFYPEPVTDDADIDQVIAYIAAHRRLRAEYRAEEIPYRAVLVAYQRDRDTERGRRTLLGLLNEAHDLRVPWTAYAPTLGWSSSAAVVMQRRWLREKQHHAPAAVTPQKQSSADPVQEWLTRNAKIVLQAATGLVDYRDDLISLATDDATAIALTEAIDTAGMTMSAKPSRSLARAVSFAAYHLHANHIRSSSNTDIQEVMSIAAKVRAGYETVTNTTKSEATP